MAHSPATCDMRKSTALSSGKESLKALAILCGFYVPLNKFAETLLCPEVIETLKNEASKKADEEMERGMDEGTTPTPEQHAAFLETGRQRFFDIHYGDLLEEKFREFARPSWKKIASSVKVQRSLLDYGLDFYLLDPDEAEEYHYESDPNHHVSSVPHPIHGFDFVTDFPMGGPYYVFVGVKIRADVAPAKDLQDKLDTFVAAGGAIPSYVNGAPIVMTFAGDRW